MAEVPPPYRHRRAVVRLLDRYRRVLAALLTAAALVSAVLAVRPLPAPTTQVLVAARDLDASGPLTEHDLTELSLPSDAVPGGALAVDARTAGLRLNAPVRHGEVITDARLSDPPARPYGSGLVAVPVRVADPGVVDLLSPGSRVDVLAAGGHDDLTPVRAGPAVEVVGDRPVLALPEGAAPDGEKGALILIAATPAEARSLAGHATASRLSVTIRG
ncbi:Flp pilus assembly protein CpaB [Nocardiopsis sp. TSRI0078]|uniref:SAF domain-containing protein n=1 Tax=unclassified Nocardiopsis TaxID=2649073 RepID=UPI00093A58F4|nr:SAF domain-containing protein [Nocardiopsis sp. TSRI0078]OKI22003.1 Flp pilus assembly protein CpaB [Nocardiopsis sp. TSRI0078]